MTSIETVDNLVLSICLPVASLALEIVHKLSMTLRIESTERKEIPYAGDEGILLHK